MAPPSRCPPELMEEIIEEVLLRFPPDDPASLVRAALVSKRWCRLISGRGFRRRFRELHRAAPLLGFVCNVEGNLVLEDESPDIARFVPTSSCLPRADRCEWRALDARHGRILLYHCASSSRGDGIHLYWGGRDSLEPFVVWDPITGAQLQLPHLPHHPWLVGFNATVLCAGGGACDSLDCHGGHFIVVFVGIYYGDGMLAYVYSSEAGAWSEPTIAQHPRDNFDLVPAALVGNSVYFEFRFSTRILKYDLGKREMSVIDTEMPYASYGRIILMTTDEGRLGFIIRSDHEFKLYLCSMEVGPQDDAVWTQDKVIELENLLPAAALLSSPGVAGYANGLGVIVIGTEDGFFTIDTKKSNQARKVGEGIACMKDGDVDIGFGHNFYTVVPYTGFYFPALQAASVSVGPSAGASRE